MKSTDIALIIFIAIVSIAISYFGANALLGDPSEKIENIQYVNDITDVIVDPDSETFNATALNPNEDIQAGKCSYGEVFDGLRCVTQEEYEKEMNDEKRLNGMMRAKLEEGIEQGVSQTIRQFHAKGMPASQIADFLDMSLDQVESILAEK